VVTTGNTKNLLKAIRLQRPDLVIVDLNIRQFNGSNILEEIRKSCHELPVIFCSAYTYGPHDSRDMPSDYVAIMGPELGELKQRIKMPFQIDSERLNYPDSDIVDRVELI
jgi:two-component SAPR family response regulator